MAECNYEGFTFSNSRKHRVRADFSAVRFHRMASRPNDSGYGEYATSGLTAIRIGMEGNVLNGVPENRG